MFFCVLWWFSWNFLPLEILYHQNAKKFFQAKSWVYFKTQNVKVFSKLIKARKIIKTGQFSKVMIYFYFNRRQLHLVLFSFLGSCDHFSYFKLGRVFSAKFVPKIAKRESFYQIFCDFFWHAKKFLPSKYVDFQQIKRNI